MTNNRSEKSTKSGDVNMETTGTSTETMTTKTKHSPLVQISAKALCNNKRLKRKRKRWGKETIASMTEKTELKKPVLCIDLVSDDEQDAENVRAANAAAAAVANAAAATAAANAAAATAAANAAAATAAANAAAAAAAAEQQKPSRPIIKLLQKQQKKEELQPRRINAKTPLFLKTVTTTEPPPLVPLGAPTDLNFPKLLLYKRENRSLSVPQLGFVKMSSVSVGSLSIQPLRPERHRLLSSPLAFSTKSIVISSDDSEVERAGTKHLQKKKKFKKSVKLPSKSPVIPSLPELTLTAISCHNNNNNNHNNNNNISVCNQPISHLQQQHDMSNVNEEEVTVSLVPRTSANNTAQLKEQQQQQHEQEDISILNKNNTFPMLPDETTVHTVIADRIYELSLSKLREGLAYGEPNVKLSKLQNSVVSSSQAPPISLKLSSDLSISLISDDEEDSVQIDKNEEARMSAEKLRRRQPQLSVQQVNVRSTAAVPHTKPKRRKLG